MERSVPRSDGDPARLSALWCDPLELQVAREALRRRMFGHAEPHHLGRYELRDRIGSGGMGVVLVGFDPKLDREVAIKVLHPTASEPTQERLLREARATARLRHPHVVSVFDVGVQDGRVYMVMELVRGP